MMQASSQNVTVEQNSTFPLNNVSIQKGYNTTLQGNTVELNCCGVYEVNMDAFVTPETAGLVSIQMFRDGVAVADALSQATGATDTIGTYHFTKLVQCNHNNTNCCCSSPVRLTFVNNGASQVTGNINVVVTQL